MNDDLINREALKRAIKTECNPYGKPTIDFESGKKVLKIIDNAPIVEERPKGKWIIGETYDCHSDIVKTYTCPFCGKKEYSNYPFCHCGAYMRGDV